MVVLTAIAANEARSKTSARDDLGVLLASLMNVCDAMIAYRILRRRVTVVISVASEAVFDAHPSVSAGRGAHSNHVIYCTSRCHICREREVNLEIISRSSASAQ